MFRCVLFAVAIMIAVQAPAEEKSSSPAKGHGPLKPAAMRQAEGLAAIAERKGK